MPARPILRALVVVTLLTSAFLGTAPRLLAQESAESKDTLEQYFKITRGELTARRDSALDAVLHLDASTAKKFQPLRQAYDAELKRLSERRIALMTDFAKVHDKLTPESAKDLADRLFKLDDDRSALRRKYYERMSAEISPVVAVQFLQLERQFETMGDLKAATLVPLATQ